MLSDIYRGQYIILNLIFFTTGNFGVIYKAWYTKDDVKYKVAIKTLKGIKLLLELCMYICVYVSTM